MNRTLSAAAAALALLAATAPAPGLAQRGEIAPEAATGSQRHKLAIARRHMISAANPHAAAAGRAMLRAGGSAIDAAIAAQLVLGLVEPQSSGLGGGAFILHHDAATAEIATYDGRERAPATARPDRFMAAGRPLSFDRAVHSGLSVGVPGLVHAMALAHARHGRMPWPSLFDPAIALAEQGFAVSPRLHLLLRWMGAQSFAPDARRYFFDDGGSPRAIGETLRNPAYAATLRRVAAEGPRGLHTGPVAEAIVAAAAAAPNAAGDLTVDDLAHYTATPRPAVCGTYRRHKVCSMGPPSSGGLAVLQVLGLVERFDLGTTPAAAMNVSALHLIAEAQKLAYADRDRFAADPDFIAVPDGLLDPVYLAVRGRAIDPRRAMPRPEAGSPPGVDRRAFGDDATTESTGTTHLSVIDERGNAVAMTSTIEAAFGARLWAAGFLLNNQLTDFSLLPADTAGRPVANRVEGGKRPRSSMAPLIVYDPGGQVLAVLGSPGGARIPLYVVKSLVALIDWRLDAQTAASLPNFGSRGGALELEADLPAVWSALRLRALGHEVSIDLMTSGLHILVRRGDHIEGGADPRREGVALGD